MTAPRAAAAPATMLSPLATAPLLEVDAEGLTKSQSVRGKVQDKEKRIRGSAGYSRACSRCRR